ncbi:hypothetical protein PFISCL1PPCAC_28644, partial [Pristionchus fissidentatus]
SNSPVIDRWMERAFTFSSIDGMGNLVTRALVLMQNLTKEGAACDKLEYLVKALQMERKLVEEHDYKKKSAVRDLMFAFCTGLEATIESVIEKKRKQENCAVVEQEIQKCTTTTTNTSVPRWDNDKLRIKMQKRLL